MVLKYNFSINQLGEAFVAVPLSNSVIEFNGILKLNETGAFIVEQLNTEISYDALVKNVMGHYDCSKEEASANIDEIVFTLKEFGLIVE